MSPSTAIDTHAYYKRLTDAGMEPRVAEVMAQESAHRLGGLVIKEDMESFRKATKEDMENSIEMLGKDLTIRLGGLMIAQAVIIIGAMKLL